MGVFDDMLKDGESLFKNPVALSFDYIPKLIPYREDHQFKIAGCVKPLFQQRNGRNIIIIGKPGVGKTVACRHVLNELEEKTDEIIPLYINCWKQNTSYKVFVELCELMNYKFTQNKKTDELFKILKQLLNKTSSVIVFDEIDKADDLDFLYMLLEEVYRKTIILITNYKNWILDVDERIKSRLMAELIEFQPYNETEIKGILEKRKDFAFYPNIWDQEAFAKVIRKTYELEDLRSGLYLMQESATIAEDASSKKIMMKHYEEAEQKLNDFFIKKKDALQESEKFILEIIKKNSGTKIGEVFKIYQKEGGNLAYKSFQRRIKKLVEDRFISAEKVTGGAEGTTTILSFEKQATTKKLTEF